MSRGPIWRIVLVLLAIGVLGACARIKEHTREQSFQEDISEYGRMIRWGFYDAARGYIRKAPPPKEDGGASRTADVPQTSEEVDTARLKPVRVTSYEIVSQRFSPRDPNRAVVRAHIEYYREDSPTVRELTDEQQWWYDEKAGRWYLDGTLPEFSR